jgi:membrane protease subunit HflC
MPRILHNPIAAGFAVLIAVIVAAATFAIVPETQQAVVLRLNNPVGGVINKYVPGQVIGNTGAGVIARVPFIDKIVWIDKRVLDADLDNTLVLSTDQLRLNVDAFARFRIVDPLRAVTSTGSTSNTEERVADQLRPLLGTALRNELGKVPFSSLLSPERGRVMDAIQNSLQRDARQYGVEIVDVRIKHADLPEGSPLESALQRMRTARQQEANTIRAQGQKQAQIVRAEADANAARIYADAFSKDAGFYDFYRAMQSYRHTFGADGGPKPEGSTNIIMSPGNSYLREFEGRTAGL